MLCAYCLRTLSLSLCNTINIFIYPTTYRHEDMELRNSNKLVYSKVGLISLTSLEVWQ